MNAKAEFYFNKGKWQEELRHLRIIVHDDKSIGSVLSEELKWGVPCYVFEDKNILLLHVFKDYCAILFFKGVLMKDPEGILIQQTKNVQSARQIRFTNVDQIIELEPVLKKYIHEAIDIEKAGLKVPMKSVADYKIPDEFQEELAINPALNTAFDALTAGRRKAYLFYFSQAKQSRTRKARIDKFVPRILEGKGLDD